MTAISGKPKYNERRRYNFITPFHVMNADVCWPLELYQWIGGK